MRGVNAATIKGENANEDVVKVRPKTSSRWQRKHMRPSGAAARPFTRPPAYRAQVVKDDAFPGGGAIFVELEALAKSTQALMRAIGAGIRLDAEVYRCDRDVLTPLSFQRLRCARFSREHIP